MSGKRKVLLVDDDSSITSYLVVKLSKLYDVVATNDPREAVALAKKEQPHVILCDIDMPHMSGGDVTAALAAEPMTAEIPVVYLTALVSPQETQDLEQVLSFLVFGDGCAASLITAEPTGFALDSFRSVVIPSTRDLITWRIRGVGFDMMLSGNRKFVRRNSPSYRSGYQPCG